MPPAGQFIAFDDNSTIRVPLDLEDRQAQLLEILESISGTVTAAPLKKYGRTNRVTDSGQSFPIPTDILARHAQLVKALENVAANGGGGGGLLRNEKGSLPAVVAQGDYYRDDNLGTYHVMDDGTIREISFSE